MGPNDEEAAALAEKVLNDDPAIYDALMVRAHIYRRATGEWPGQVVVNRWAKEELDRRLDR